MHRRLFAFMAGLVIGPVAVAVWRAAASLALQWEGAALAILDLALITLAVLQRPRLAVGAGILLGVGLTFAYLFIDQASRCTADRGCTLGDNSVQIAIVSTFVAAGVILLFVAFRRRTANAS